MSATVIGKGVKITFYGHAAMKLEGAGASVLIDPWLSNPLLQTPISALGAVSLILVTHGHADHLGETVEIAQATGAPVAAIHELSQYLLGKGLTKVIGMNKGGTMSEGGVRVTMTQAVHSSTVEEGGSSFTPAIRRVLWWPLPTASWPITPGTPRCSKTWNSSGSCIIPRWPCSPSAATTS